MKTKEKTTRMAFTAAELETMYFALNAYSCKNMHDSDTWANMDAIAEGRKDVYHRIAEMSLRLQNRTYEAQKRLEQ